VVTRPAVAKREITLVRNGKGMPSASEMEAVDTRSFDGSSARCIIERIA
jgi:hypothetical protein